MVNSYQLPVDIVPPTIEIQYFTVQNDFRLPSAIETFGGPVSVYTLNLHSQKSASSSVATSLLSGISSYLESYHYPMTNLMSDGGPASCKVVLAGTVAKELMVEVSKSLSILGKAPLLVGFLANQDPAARKYAEWTDRTCQEK